MTRQRHVTDTYRTRTGHYVRPRTGKVVEIWEKNLQRLLVRHVRQTLQEIERNVTQISALLPNAEKLLRFNSTAAAAAAYAHPSGHSLSRSDRHERFKRDATFHRETSAPICEMKAIKRKTQTLTFVNRFFSTFPQN